MIKQIVLAVTVAGVLMMTGCSSEPKSSEEVAEVVCEAFKKGDLSTAEKFMSPEALAKTKQNEGVIKQFFALPEFKQKARGLDCRKSKKQEQLGEDHIRFYFGEFNVELKKIDGAWKLLS